ncbi:MAG: ABC transporter permease subunit [Stellaceae bacterium]
MSPTEIAATLARWTPFLAGGFLWNIVVSLSAMTIGTVLGALLALLRLSHRPALCHTGLALTECARNVPTFVFLFYLAFLIPAEFRIGGATFAIPEWLKASLALSIAVVGFVSDNLSEALPQWRAGDIAAALLFVPNWTAYFLIIVMASSTASVIGVGELVSRCNTVIGAVGNPALMLWIYLYAMLWFFLACYPLTLAMRRVRRMIARRARKPAPAAYAAAAARSPR